MLQIARLFPRFWHLREYQGFFCFFCLDWLDLYTMFYLLLFFIHSQFCTNVMLSSRNRVRCLILSTFHFFSHSRCFVGCLFNFSLYYKSHRLISSFTLCLTGINPRLNAISCIFCMHGNISRKELSKIDD